METPPNFSDYPRAQMHRVVRMEALGEAFRLFGQAPGPYMLGALPLLVSFVIYYVLDIGIQFALMGFTQPRTPNFGVIFEVLGLQCLVLFLFVMAYYWCLGGLTRMALKQLRGEEISAKDVFLLDGMGWRVVGLSLLNVLVGCFGFMLCLVPGYIFQGLLMISVPVLIDRRTPITTAMSESWTAVKPSMWTATGLMFITAMVLGLSMAACGVGLLVGAPVYALVQAITYRDLYWAGEDAIPPAPYDIVEDRGGPARPDPPPYEI